MQLPSDIFLAEAVDADIRTIVYKFEADWNRNGLYDHPLSDLTEVVEEMLVERDIINALPIETTMVEGYFASQLKIRLAGTRSNDTRPIAEELSPWRSDAQLYSSGRQSVSVRGWIGHKLSTGTETQLQQFSGRITEVTVDSASREVNLICADGSEDCQKEIDLPVFALPPNSNRTFGMNLMLRTNSQWAIDYAFRKCGFYMSPPTHSRTFYSATMHGSPVPEIGHQTFFWIGAGVANEEDQVYYPGRPGWGLSYGGNHRWYGVIQSRGYYTDFRPVSGYAMVIQCQVDASRAANVYPGQGGNLVMYSSGNGYLVGNSMLMKVDSGGHLIIDFFNGSTLAATANGPFLSMSGWQNCWAEIEFGTPLSNSTVRFPGLTVGIDLSGLDTSPAIETYPHIFTFAQIPIHDLQITNRTGLATGTTRYNPDTWVPQVDMDTGLNDVTGLPLRRGVKAWDLIREVVQAEYGVVGFSESGRPFFKNRSTVRRASLNVVKTLDQEKALTSFNLSERVGSVRNVVTSSYAPRLMDGPLDSLASWRVIWELKDSSDFLVGSGTTVLDVQTDVPGARIDCYASGTQFTTTQWNDAANSFTTKHGFVTQKVEGGEVTSGVTVRAVPLSPTAGLDRMRIYITNTSGFWLKFQTTDGQPALRIRGNGYYADTAREQQFRRNSSVSKYGSRVFDIPTSEWHQLATPLRNISNTLLKDLKAPVPTINQIDAVGDCRLQLTDTAQVEDRDGLGGPQVTTVAGIRRQLQITDQGAKLTDSLTLRPVSAPGKWILGHTTWSVLGSTTQL